MNRALQQHSQPFFCEHSNSVAKNAHNIPNGHTIAPKCKGNKKQRKEQCREQKQHPGVGAHAARMKIIPSVPVVKSHTLHQFVIFC